MSRLRATWPALAALVIVLLVPFVARSRKVAAPHATGGHETLIIITANNANSMTYSVGANLMV